MKRGYGILLPVFSLPSAFGIGDFGPEAYRFADLLAENGAAYWQALPLNPGNPDGGESPYFSASSFAINPLFLSLEKLRNDGLVSNGELAGLPAFARNAVDYDTLREMRLPLLQKAAMRFGANAESERFFESNRSWLNNFALYEVIRAERKEPWPAWPVPFRDRDDRALSDFAESRHDDIRAWKMLQYFAFVQWKDLHGYCRDRNLRIIGDMPIYVSLDSADAWANPGLFKLDRNKHPQAVSGVPPDYFSATGQLWNNPVYDWPAHRASGFSWWVSRMRRLFSLYDILRIDHFRGLIQYWEIPSVEKTAVKGKWMDVPTYELFDTLLKEINPFPVICEDLGFITDDVRAAMKKYRFPGMKVLQFAFDNDDGLNPYLPQHYNKNCVVYTGTHDNVPTVGWLHKCVSAQERARIARYIGRTLNDRETVWGLIELAIRSNADIAIFPLQDVLTLDASSRINDPATIDGNWRWRWDHVSDSATLAMKRIMKLGELSERI